jgi:hypothetical protein
MAAKTLPDREYVRECLDYNPDTGKFRWRARPFAHFMNSWRHNWWNAKYAGKAAGHNLHGYVRIKLDGALFGAHRLAWLLERGEPVPAEIDHINGISSDNWISNFRAADRGQNVANTGRLRNNRSGVKGVRVIRSGRFEARIRANGTPHILGVFDTKEEAAEARRTAAIRLHGEFARHE